MENPEEKIAEIVRTMKNYDLASSPAWSDLDALSSRTLLDGVEIDPDGIIVKGNTFRGPLSIYVLLQYDEAGEDSFETSDSFMGEFSGHFSEGGGAVIDQVTVDTSPFYEGENAS